MCDKAKGQKVFIKSTHSELIDLFLDLGAVLCNGLLLSIQNGDIDFLNPRSDGLRGIAVLLMQPQ